MDSSSSSQQDIAYLRQRGQQERTQYGPSKSPNPSHQGTKNHLDGHFHTKGYLRVDKEEILNVKSPAQGSEEGADGHGHQFILHKIDTERFCYLLVVPNGLKEVTQPMLGNQVSEEEDKQEEGKNDVVVGRFIRELIEKKLILSEGNIETRCPTGKEIGCRNLKDFGKGEGH